MKELIKEAEELYNQLNGIPMEIFSNRTNKDPYGVNYYIREMGDLTCKMLAFLKKLIDRKDNIVDLGEVWHDITEEPLVGNTIVYLTKNHAIGTLKRVDKNTYSWYIEKYAICKWAYTKDLLPKGGEVWNTTK